MLSVPRLLLTVATATVVLAPRVATESRRWNSTGHEVIAAIAWSHLTPLVRTKVVALLRHGPPEAHLGDLEPTSGTPDERARRLFVAASTWSDLIRNREIAQHAYDRSAWHYADTFWKEKDGKIEPLPEMRPGAENAVERISAMRAVLAAAGADSSRAVALAWIEHLVGDIHQPLHASSRVTPELPKGDRGGNDFRLGGNPNSLHAYWDDILDLVERPDGDLEAGVDRWASVIEERHPISSFTAAELDAGVDVWARESVEIAQRVLYPPTLAEHAVPSAEYRKTADGVAETRIALAGYRLAAVLNKVIK
jgi:S1/P1 nuclease